MLQVTDRLLDKVVIPLIFKLPVIVCPPAKVKYLFDKFIPFSWKFPIIFKLLCVNDKLIAPLIYQSKLLFEGIEFHREDEFNPIAYG